MRMNIEYVSTVKPVPCDGCDNQTQSFTAIYTYYHSVARLCNNCHYELTKAFMPVVDARREQEAEANERRKRYAEDRAKDPDEIKCYVDGKRYYPGQETGTSDDE